MDIKKIVIAATQVAKEAWKIALEYQKEWFKTKEKTSYLDIVTEADQFLDTYITNELRKITPTRNMRSEENENEPETLDGYTWIIDPIDWTYDFFHGFSWWSVLIWLAKDAVPYAWIMMIPTSWKVYTAIQWEWYYSEVWDIRHKPYKVSNCKELNNALVHYSTQLHLSFSKTQCLVLSNYAWRYTETKNNYFEELIHGTIEWSFCSQKVCGPRDVCAPAVLIQEAWWVCTSLDWRPFNFMIHKKLWYIVSNWKIHNDLLLLTDKLNSVR